MTNRDRLIAALCGTLGDGGEAMKEAMVYLMQCPYRWAYRLTHYAGGTPLCSYQDGTAAPDRCKHCMEEWLDTEVEE